MGVVRDERPYQLYCLIPTDDRRTATLHYQMRELSSAAIPLRDDGITITQGMVTPSTILPTNNLPRHQYSK